MTGNPSYPFTYTQLYRHFDKKGTLLYVGIAVCSFERLKCHRFTHKQWFRRIASITIEHYRTVKTARAAELEAIRTEAPLFNKCAVALVAKRERRKVTRTDRFTLSDRSVKTADMKNKKQIKKASRKVSNPKLAKAKAAIKAAGKAAVSTIKSEFKKKDGDLLNFRAPEIERKAFKAKAKKFAHGNMSAWLRFAGAHFTPKSVPKNLGVVQPISR